MAADSEKALPVGPLESLVGYHLRRASSAFLTDFMRAMEGTGMRQVLIGILSIVAANPGINQGNVGRLLGIKRANMVALINELLERGLIKRANAKDDKRAFTLRLSEKGEAALAESLVRIRAHEAHMLKELNPDEQATLVVLLGRIQP
ncbi:MAG TPA: MarR family transcriptional regulator [Sphingomicrobium sp.]